METASSVESSVTPMEAATTVETTITAEAFVLKPTAARTESPV